MIWKVSDKSILKTFSYGALNVKASKNKEMVCVPDYNDTKIYIISTSTY